MGAMKTKEAFHTEEADRADLSVVSRRAGPVQPFEHIDFANTEVMKNKLFERFGFEEYCVCWSGEMHSRPIPFVSTDPKPKRVAEAVGKWIKVLLAYLSPYYKASVLPINKVSRLGYPVMRNPGDGSKGDASKFDYFLHYLNRFWADDTSWMKGAVHTIGVRKQFESPSKHREMQFITDNAEVVTREITAQERSIEVPGGVGRKVGSRTRTIVQPPVMNNILQAVDSMIHSAIMATPLCNVNMYAIKVYDSNAKFRTFDCKHYERVLGMCAKPYSNAIGGVYSEWLNTMIDMAFLVPSDTWKSAFIITPLYSETTFPQFSSGLSPVAPLGKIANICVQAEFFESKYGLKGIPCIQAVMDGNYDGFERSMYGDDNRVQGSGAAVDDFLAHMGEFFDIEEDKRPKFLGMEYDEVSRRFLLPVSTYVLKLMLPERSYSWKEFGSLGLVERRKIFSSFGHPDIAAKVIPFEDELWAEAGYPFQLVVTKAAEELRKANSWGAQDAVVAKYSATDKDYLLTDEQRAASSRYWHLSPSVVMSLIHKLVGDENKPLIPFQDPKSKPPKSEKLAN